MGNDSILCGDGNDLVFGDAYALRAPLVTMVQGGLPKAETDWRVADRWHERGSRAASWTCLYYPHQRINQLDGIAVNADTIAGGAGPDLIWGDGVILQSTTVKTAAGVSAVDAHIASDNASVGLVQLATVTDESQRWLPLLELCDDADNADVIQAEDGNDIVYGQDGVDTINGGPGNDWVMGGLDVIDKLDGGSGTNRVYPDDFSSPQLTDLVKAAMPSWSTTYSGLGVPIVPFSSNTVPVVGHPVESDNFDRLAFAASPWDAAASTQTLADSPAIDWSGNYFASVGVSASGIQAVANASSPNWLGDFVNHLAQTPGQQAPNADLRLWVSAVPQESPEHSTL
jgi:hypothetical protein